MEYNDEFVVGAEHEFRGGITASVRYIDRRAKRIIEDFQGVSIEQFDAQQFGNYFIGNPGPNSDITVNPNPVVFSQSAIFERHRSRAQCVDSNGVATPYTP